jgi:hypothetical protein
MRRVTPAVGVAREVPILLRQAGRPVAGTTNAASQEWLWREKIEGVWIYGTTEESIRLAEVSVARLATETLHAWLLGPMHPLTGFIAKQLNLPLITKKAVGQIIRKLLRADDFGAVAALTNDYEPHLAVFVHDDNGEVERQVSFMTEMIDTRGRLSTADLPAPVRQRTLRVWRDVILRHGEYLGLGHMESSDLVAWA